MVVVDASIVLKLLLDAGSHTELAERILSAHESLHAPEMMDLEIAQVLHSYQLREELSDQRGQQALEDLSRFPLKRYPSGWMLSRIWKLSHHLTVNEAAYITLAEALNATLVTADPRVAHAAGHEVHVEVWS